MTRWARAATLIGYFGLLFVLMARLTVLAPPELVPVSVALLLLVGPLLFPLRGILHARPYTHAWASFMALFYFTVGVFHAAGNGREPWLAWIEIGLSVLFFSGAVLFARLRGRELRSVTSKSGAETGAPV